jgi:hypothetical protein
MGFHFVVMFIASFRSRKLGLTTVGIRRADHVTLLYPQSWH